MFILKGFHSYHRYTVQDSYTSSLAKAGFNHSYTFAHIVKEPPLFFEQVYYGCLHYIKPSEEEFTFHHEQNRKEGLTLLNQYHLTSATMVAQYESILPTFHQIEKWYERSALFFKNLHILYYFVQKEIIHDYLFWADWSLKGMKNYEELFTSKGSVVLHGDLAHHNFLRGEDRHLYLIDFDLISIGTASSDYLQYANRILPFIDWSLSELKELDTFHPFLAEKGFLYGLTYPTDIFREWNRAIREKSYLEGAKLKPLLELTVGQFQKRQEFCRSLQLELNSL